MKLRLSLPLFAASLAALCLAGCGKKDAAPAAKAAAAAPAQGADGILLTGNDAMKYNLNSISLKVGEQSKITLRNIGTMPKVAMGHNLVILKPGTDVDAFSVAAAAAQDNDYIPAALEGQILYHTKMLGPKESATLDVKFDTAGEYPFLCTFPAHYAVGMKGTISVQ
ncbi:hypothetical protein AXK11_08330 [Cephaloticoccus primus]|uniref:Blue (type 1) copper domain-containing protein n=1 Tax=Cephaloticoccus primus TaxID=1548207 RepID=A0A139SIV6_9BACT|nr:plastocyanin/azurin family copper-binding protein [Cephaloticoccus primus]KXU34487.1 hypothetical protein AXK11_08330 [Cephaloticoccus primus]